MAQQKEYFRQIWEAAEAENAKLRTKNERLRKAAMALIKIVVEPYRITAQTFGDEGEAWRLINELGDALGVRG